MEPDERWECVDCGGFFHPCQGDLREHELHHYQSDTDFISVCESCRFLEC